MASCEHTDLIVNKGEHVFDNGFVTKSPTEYEEGITTFTCTTCKYTRTELISRLPHTHKFDTEEYAFNENYHWKNATCEHTTVTTAAQPHNRGGSNVCLDCGHMAVSEGLSFTLLSNGTYELSGRGTNKDSCVVVPATYEGKPVTSVGANAFNSSLEIIKKIKLPASVTKIGAYAFNTCPHFEEVIFDGKSSLTYIGEYAFYGCDTAFTDFTIPKSVTYIGEAAFMSCKVLKNLAIEDGNTSYRIIDGNLYTADGTKLLQYVLGNEATEFAVPDTVTELGIGAFAFSPYLEKITFSAENTMTVIPIEAFHYSLKIKEIQLPLGITVISDGAFDRCTALNTLNIPENVVTIGNYAFNYCESLPGFTLPSSVKTLGEYSFAYCHLFTRFDIPEGVTTIGNRVLAGCLALTEVTIPKTVTKYGVHLFYGASALTNVIVHDDNTKLKSIAGNLYTKNGTTLIYYCVGKTETDFTLPSGVTTISDSAFYCCRNLVNVTLPSGLKSIGKEAFLQCKKLKTISTPDSIASIGTAAFKDCNSLVEFTIPASLATLSSEMLLNCDSLKALYIPSTVKKIEARALGYQERDSVTFEVTTGWICSYTVEGNYFSLEVNSEDIADPQKAVIFTDAHAGYTWTRAS